MLKFAYLTAEAQWLRSLSMMQWDTEVQVTDVVSTLKIAPIRNLNLWFTLSFAHSLDFKSQRLHWCHSWVPACGIFVQGLRKLSHFSKQLNSRRGAQKGCRSRWLESSTSAVKTNPGGANTLAQHLLRCSAATRSARQTAAGNSSDQCLRRTKKPLLHILETHLFSQVSGCQGTSHMHMHHIKRAAAIKSSIENANNLSSTLNMLARQGYDCC